MSFAAIARTLVGSLAGPRKGLGLRVFLRASAEDLGTDLARVAVQLTFLAHQAWDMLDAVGVTLARLVTRQGPLPAVGDRRRGRARAPGALGVRGFYDAMRASPIIARPRAADGRDRCGRRRLPSALPIIVLWAFAPLIAYQLSKPAPSSRPEITERRSRATCGRSRARRGSTSRRSSAPDDRWLPPDNVQIDPEPRIAHRTSPTNIAMSLLASLSAHDLGFIDADALVERLDATLTTIDRLEHFEGHLLNWYDTQTPGAAAAEVRLDGRQRQLRRRRC